MKEPAIRKSERAAAESAYNDARRIYDEMISNLGK
jgi:hypothetical protein